MTALFTDPIHKSRSVPLAPDAAFSLFARDFGLWWPGARHSVSARAGRAPRALRIEPFKGGRIIETTDDGRDVIWGHVIAWDDGRYIAFTILPGGIVPDADGATVVAVSFRPEDTGTRVDLTHGNFDILGPLADAISTAWLRHWGLAIGCYAAACQKMTAPAI